MEASDVRRTLSRLRVEQVLGAILGLLLVFLVVDLFRQLLTGALDVSTLRRYVWQGIVVGLIYGLAGIGLSMTYSILRFANFSHGDLLTTGAFSGWASAYVIAGFGAYGLGDLLLVRPNNDPAPGQIGMAIDQEPIAILGGIAFAAVVTVLIALAADRLVYRRLRNESAIALLIASVGVAFVLRYLIAFVFTTSNRSVPASAPEETIDLGFVSTTVDLHELTLVTSAVVLMVAVHLMLQYTKLGKSMRAMADNRDLAKITGIPTERVVLATWVIGAALAGVAGYLIVLNTGTITYTRGWTLLLPIFAGVILGGIGSIYGAILGGLVIGIVDQVAIIWVPNRLTTAAAFLLMILILIFRPQGLLGGVETA
ncbi:branched-chain amino acid ABC-type transport system, permease component [Salinarchaeum sp. Harcht-Bsk1]|uniref:branched-chain amino acid ABC transporter permease n=1 Tax=Salinarchaeum sp. Harcht-Bsk1 TaxID=1333523 RepID=UPI0003422B0E|nr:branched-chain amino acid ABC transporter permease [Salinarchaeum sp. Harcht-Bsk1]AGN01307.1 branched-chain amino acid ABC-type transport system, permease component [Salinarchaeum sp. Harcht-Bsk1]